MKRIDVHTHMFGGTGTAQQLVDNMEKAGVYAATVFSKAPDGMLGRSGTSKERLDELLNFTEGRENLYPFYFVDPTEEDIIEQLEMTRAAGVKGYKVMCTHFYPGDDRAMKCYEWMARNNMPAMFHSGILYDGINPSGKYNRPCEFEPLLAVENFRFSLAHLSWPWTDECIAVFGKFHDYLYHHPDGKAAKMYLDITPGTPPTYRENALYHLFGNDFPVEEIVIWGSDTNAQSYDVDYAKSIMDRDCEIFNKLGISEKVQEDIFCNNYLKFLEG